MTNTGFGGGGWGATSFGDGSPFALAAVFPVADNVLRLVFSDPPYWSGLLDDGDAADPSRYTVVPVPGLLDGSGAAPRAVSAVATVLALVVNGGGLFIDLTLDRPMSTFPAAYTVTVAGIRPAPGTGPAIDPAFASAVSTASGRLILPAVAEVILPSRDIANPASAEAAAQAGSDPSKLGRYVVNEKGDYAGDYGLVALKKRIWRRLTTRKGAFSHAPDYGVGLLDEMKRLATPAVRQRLVNEAEQQILQEPEVIRVRVSMQEEVLGSGVFRFIVLVQTQTGLSGKFTIPVTSSVDLENI